MDANIVVTGNEDTGEQIVVDVPKKRHPVRLTLIIVGAVLLAALIGATVVAEPWVKPLTAEAPPPPIERQLAAVDVTEGEKITLAVPLTEDEAIKSVEGATVEQDGIVFIGKSAGEKAVSIVTEEKEAPAVPALSTLGKIRARLRGVIGIAPDEYRTDKAETAEYTISVKVLAAEPEQVQGEGIALDFEDAPSKIIVCGEAPVVSVADETIAKAAVVGYTVVVKPVSEQGGETSLEVTADGAKTTYPIAVAAKPEDKPTGGSSGSSSRPSGGSSGSSSRPSGSSSGSGQSSSSQSSSAPATQTVTVAEVEAYVKAYAAQIGMRWESELTKDNASWGKTTAISIFADEQQWKQKVRTSMDFLYSIDVRHISALTYQSSQTILVEYLY